MKENQDSVGSGKVSPNIQIFPVDLGKVGKTLKQMSIKELYYELEKLDIQGQELQVQVEKNMLEGKKVSYELDRKKMEAGDCSGCPMHDEEE